MNLNKVFLLGNLTRDPEVRTTPSGQTVATFGLATNRVWKDKAGQKQEKAEFHNIVLWGRLAEISAQYLRKGQNIFIEGRIENRSWTGPDGQKKYKTEIIAENMQMGPKTDGSAGNYSPEANSKVAATEEIPTISQDEPPAADLDDIPF
jgi:single-strand DNA-binding protein